MTARRQQARRGVLAFALVGVFLAWAGYFSFVFYQVWRHATIDEARPADAIVVFGAAQYWGRPSPVLKARLDHALELFEEGYAPRIITTGGQGPGAKFTEGEVSRAYLSERGVAAERVTVEAAGSTTMQSAAAVAEIMDRMQLSSCIVVSDGYHIHRIKKILEEYGLKVYGSPRASRLGQGWRQSRRYVRESLSYILWRIGIRV